MNSLTDLREVVDVVIGVDTHVHTHSAAVVDTATGGVLDESPWRRQQRAIASSNCSALSSQRPNRSEAGSAARSSPQCSPPPRTASGRAIEVVWRTGRGLGV